MTQQPTGISRSKLFLVSLVLGLLVAIGSGMIWRVGRVGTDPAGVVVQEEAGLPFPYMIRIFHPASGTIDAEVVTVGNNFLLDWLVASAVLYVLLSIARGR